MKIAILTQPLRVNFGGILQNYALQQVLLRWGHKVETIDYKIGFSRPWYQVLLRLPYRFFHRFILRHRSVELFSEWMPIVKYQMKNILPFIEKNIKVRYISSIYKEIMPSDYQAFIVGSDQVWRYLFNRQFIDNSYLHFTENWTVKRIAYAASFGTDNWEYPDSEREKYKKLLAQFDSVSVREESGKYLCQKYFERQAEWVLDPAMLLNKADYLCLLPEQTMNCKKGSLLTYILNETSCTTHILSILTESFSLQPFSTNNPNVENSNLSKRERVQPSIESWIQGFNDAEYVLTDSFHACVFSILFQKPFVVLINKARGRSRIDSLLSKFNLQYRIIENEDDVLQVFSSTIDWKSVNQLLKEYRVSSESFLSRALSD